MINYRRIERDCPSNIEARRRSNKPQLINDYQVLVDGEHVATWWRDIGKGYRLRTADGREAILDPMRAWDTQGHLVKAIAEFDPAIAMHLEPGGGIPSASGRREMEIASEMIRIEVDYLARSEIKFNRARAQSIVMLALLRGTSLLLNAPRVVPVDDLMRSELHTHIEVLLATVDEEPTEDQLESARWNVRHTCNVWC